MKCEERRDSELIPDCLTRIAKEKWREEGEKRERWAERTWLLMGLVESTRSQSTRLHLYWLSIGFMSGVFLHTFENPFNAYSRQSPIGCSFLAQIFTTENIENYNKDKNRWIPLSLKVLIITYEGDRNGSYPLFTFLCHCCLT